MRYIFHINYLHKAIKNLSSGSPAYTPYLSDFNIGLKETLPI